MQGVHDSKTAIVLLTCDEKSTAPTHAAAATSATAAHFPRGLRVEPVREENITKAERKLEHAQWKDKEPRITRNMSIFQQYHSSHIVMLEFGTSHSASL